MLKFGRKSIFNQVETFFSKVVHSSPIPHLQNTRREERTFLGKKKMKILWHLAMFAENDGGVIVPNPKYFELFGSVFKLL